ncbi:MAG: glycosyltransferase [Gemmatimonadetes bacterium]|nr:glycosyltransferase [Gemmatimonadota bacterium]
MIPVFNDSTELARQLEDLRTHFGDVEVIVADGESWDDPGSVAVAHDALFIESEPGRGPQMNAGAGAANGSVLWFLHADSVVDPGSIGAIERALADPDAVGGAFRFSLAKKTWYKPMLDASVGWRTNTLRQAYGDQGIFVRAEVFRLLGGYPPIARMEDLVFFRRLRDTGPVAALDTPIGVNPRRWERDGFLRTTARNLIAWWWWDLRGKGRGR